MKIQQSNHRNMTKSASYNQKTGATRKNSALRREKTQERRHKKKSQQTFAFFSLVSIFSTGLVT